MVIERFRAGNPDAVGQRFRARGRLMPDGAPIAYVASWMTSDGAACYQLMEAPNAAALEPWMNAWRDLVDFEVVPVLTSADFWAGRTG
ncbi:MAG: DUF3303 family protein [Phycisphaeraceae bacterium]|nr:DUF3303 family protein [Phycisphaeraceae bacterium]